MGDPVRLERSGAVATLTLDRPQAGNAIDVAMADALLDRALTVESDVAVRCVVLTGAGGLFCAGGDVRAFAEAGPAAGALTRRLTAPLHAAIARFARMDKPLVTAVNGAAAGAGLGLAVLGDVCLAARSAKFAAAYGGLGLSPDAGASWLVPRLVGLRQAQRLLLAGERIDAQEAERIGLVTRTVDDDALADEARAAAERLATVSMTAFRRTRELLHESFGSGLETQLEREAQAIARCAAGPDGLEGVAAFAARRPPCFG